MFDGAPQITWYCPGGSETVKVPLAPSSRNSSVRISGADEITSNSAFSPDSFWTANSTSPAAADSDTGSQPFSVSVNATAPPPPPAASPEPAPESSPHAHSDEQHRRRRQHADLPPYPLEVALPHHGG